MSKLDELIKELCPNGVEYKELGSQGFLVRPKVEFSVDEPMANFGII